MHIHIRCWCCPAPCPRADSACSRRKTKHKDFLLPLRPHENKSKNTPHTGQDPEADANQATGGLTLTHSPHTQPTCLTGPLPFERSKGSVY